MELIDNMIDKVENRCTPNLEEICFSFFDRWVLEKENDGRVGCGKMARMPQKGEGRKESISAY